MAEYDWIQTRGRAIELYGAGPHALTEEEVRSVFSEHPGLIHNAIERIGNDYANGKVFNPWGLLRTEARAIAAAPVENIHVTDNRDRDKRAAKAEAWIRSSGIHLDREAELTDELFDRPDATLKAWRSDTELRERMAALWRKERPRGEQAELESLAWQAKLKADRERARAHDAERRRQQLETAKAELEASRQTRA